METKVLILVFLSFACFLHTINAQCGSVASNSNAFQFLAKCDNNLPKNPKTDVLATTSTSYKLLAIVKGGTLTNYTNLIQGKTYTFTTCEQSATCPATFDSVMVIRNPDGVVLQSNDNCASCTKCPSSGTNYNSQIAYTHSTSSYSWVTISIHNYSPSSSIQSCTSSVGTRRSLNLYHKVDTTSTPCVYNLVCNNVTANLAQTGSISVSGLQMSAASTPCDLNASANKTSFNCGNIGENVVLVSLYDRTCISYVTIRDTRAPLFDDQTGCGAADVLYNFTSITNDNSNPYCVPGEQCFVNVYSILPPQLKVNVQENCLVYDYYPAIPDFNQLQAIGDTFNYKAYLEDAYGNRIQIDCTDYVVRAIHILDIEEDNVFNEEFYFLDTKYNIKIEYSLTAPDPEFEIGLLPRSEYAQISEIVYATYESFDTDIFTDVVFQGGIIEPGTYELIVIETSGANNIVSIGNPLVHIVGEYF